MNTHFDEALNCWEHIKTAKLDFGRHAIKAIQTEHKTIRDFSVALCGNSSLEDKIGRYIMAAEFADSLNPYQYEKVMDWLTATHFTELYKHEQAYDHEAAIELMFDCITENPGGSVNVKPAEWIRAQRDRAEVTSAELFHRFWKSATKALLELQSVLARKGNLITSRDKKMLAILKAAVLFFQAEPESETA